VEPLTKADRVCLADSVLGVIVYKNRLTYIVDQIERSKGEIQDASFDDLLYIRKLLATYFRFHNTDDILFEELTAPLQAGTRFMRCLTATESIQWPTDPFLRISVEYSIPQWLLEAWSDSFGLEGVRRLCKECNNRGPVTVRANTLKVSREQLQVKLASEGVESLPTKYSPWGLTFTQGRPSGGTWQLSVSKQRLMELQDEGSQLIALATGVSEGTESVLDYCAGAGGKSMALAGMLGEGRGVIHAWEPFSNRRETLRDRIIENNLQYRITVEESLQEVEALSMDCTLVDAPCSSSGTLRRHPELRWRMEEDIAMREMPELQKEILANASRTVRPGGVLVYATCSLLVEENEDVAMWFASSSFGEDFEPMALLEPPFEDLRRNGRRPQTRAEMKSSGEKEKDGIGGDRDDHMLTLAPHLHGTDGFFIARWRRHMIGK